MFIQLWRVEDERLIDVYTLETCYQRMCAVLAGRRRRGRAGANNWLVGNDPTAADLDKNISSEVPVVILNASFHFAYANTKAVEVTGMSKENGVFVEDEVFELAAPIFTDLYQERPMRFVLMFLQNLRNVLREAVSKGITLMWDAMLGSTYSRVELDFFNGLAEEGIMPVRFGGALKVLREEHLRLWKDAGVTPGTFKSGKFRVPNVKITADASMQGLTAFMYEKYVYPNPYINTEFPCGIWNYEDIDFPSLLKAIDKDGWALMIHSNGDHSMDRVLDAIAAVNAENPAAKQKRNRTEHTTCLTDIQIKRFVNAGLSPSFLIGHVGYWGHAFQTKILPKRSHLVVRTRSCIDAGLRVTLHSDMGVSPLGALRMVEQSVTRIMEADADKGVLSREEWLTMAQALRAVTYDAAWQCHMEDVCEELVVGKRADFVILNKDPMGFDEAEALVKVCETWMDGKLMYERK
ncbi:Amidohydrolase [Gracilaria domingensis]|nr:Amidohydrolase [Gracilaria domingensis]